jgi:hypothetical protein
VLLKPNIPCIRGTMGVLIRRMTRARLPTSTTHPSPTPRLSSALRAAPSAVLPSAPRRQAHFVEKFKGGFAEAYLLTREGKYESNYARLQGMKTVLPVYPTGTPQTQLPGFDYLPSIGAVDVIPSPAPVGSKGNGAH